uniref:hypothetical protein n=1 Tax=Acetomicrobium sp. S15 = DSM 107314 TaxID=2529858 RepID=UPI001E453CBE
MKPCCAERVAKASKISERETLPTGRLKEIGDAQYRDLGEKPGHCAFADVTHLDCADLYAFQHL